MIESFNCKRCRVPLGKLEFTNNEASWQVVCPCGASYIASSHGLTFREGCRHPKFVDGPPALRLNIIFGIKKRAAEHAQEYCRLVDICAAEIKDLQQVVTEERVFDNKLNEAIEKPEMTAEQLIRHFGEEKLAAILNGRG